MHKPHARLGAVDRQAAPLRRVLAHRNKLHLLSQRRGHGAAVRKRPVIPGGAQPAGGPAQRRRGLQPEDPLLLHHGISGGLQAGAAPGSPARSGLGGGRTVHGQLLLLAGDLQRRLRAHRRGVGPLLRALPHALPGEGALEGLPALRAVRPAGGLLLWLQYLLRPALRPGLHGPPFLQRGPARRRLAALLSPVPPGAYGGAHRGWTGPPGTPSPLGRHLGSGEGRARRHVRPGGDAQV